VEPVFCTWIKQHIRDWRTCIVVAPDEGSAKRSVMIANALELEFAMIHNRHKNSINKNSVLSRDGSVCSDDELVHIVGESGKKLPTNKKNYLAKHR
jgi:phosphoribosylpyrophosphate synthetase